MIKGIQYGLFRMFLAAPLLNCRTFASTGKTIKLIFDIQETNSKKTVDALVGETILDVATKNSLPLEGACEGNCACATCHVLLDGKALSEVPEPGEEEEDLLQVAFGRKANSRLGCQVKIAEGMSGSVVTIPSQTRNINVKKF
eukprot:TRINITY_DN17602_c0_g1_i1.p2 TRINITY_DN17602_c0_g1~~TRINITY_DN17602_c0_g1_i1.p2  ORF type:complete len:143 (-),score=25.83 TRINITY_DN17602_c0_g1_i1:124-552(-)